MNAPDQSAGNVKATRDDWLNAAMDLLVSQGVNDVKVLSIGAKLGVSRSSFYWYFKSRKDMLSQLLERWEARNTGILIRHSQLPAETINGALNNFFLCMFLPDGFDPQLDFAVREWSRRDDAVRRVLDRNDTARTDALKVMFERFGYAPAEADIRARVLYYQQIGYYALELTEPVEVRLGRVAGYLHAFTGVRPTQTEVDAFRRAVLQTRLQQSR